MAAPKRGIELNLFTWSELCPWYFAVSGCEMLKNMTGPTSWQLILDSNLVEKCFSRSCKLGHGLQLYWRECGFTWQSYWTESREMSASIFGGKSFFFTWIVLLNEVSMHLAVLLYSISVTAQYNKIWCEMFSFQFLFNQRAVKHQVFECCCFLCSNGFSFIVVVLIIISWVML